MRTLLAVVIGFIGLVCGKMAFFSGIVLIKITLTTFVHHWLECAMFFLGFPACLGLFILADWIYDPKPTRPPADIQRAMQRISNRRFTIAIYRMILLCMRNLVIQAPMYIGWFIVVISIILGIVLGISKLMSGHLVTRDLLEWLQFFFGGLLTGIAGAPLAYYGDKWCDRIDSEYVEEDAHLGSEYNQVLIKWGGRAKQHEELDNGLQI